MRGFKGVFIVPGIAELHGRGWEEPCVNAGIIPALLAGFATEQSH